MLTLSEASSMLHASIRGADVRFESVSTDTRTVGPGQLFVALSGERFDGHHFVAQAFERGAAAAMVQNSQADSLQALGPLLVVEDTRLGLGALASAWRDRLAAKIIAVTGSNGKTTVKEMLAAILQTEAGPDAVIATQGNLNNDIGMPLSLLRARAEHRFIVLEMGMNHAGELTYLSALAKPDVALVNNAQSAHLEGLGDVAGVARAKAEIYSGLRADGVAVVNADDAHTSLFRSAAAGHSMLTFGIDHPADVRGRYQVDLQGTRVHIALPTCAFDVMLGVPGAHNVCNALAASACATAVGVSSDAIRTALERFSGVKGRLQRRVLLHGATFIDDTYNANPDSVRAAIDVLAQAPGERVLVLGDMGELGAASSDLHTQVGLYAKSRADRLFTLGEASRHATEAFGGGACHFDYIEDLLAEIERLLAPDVTVLVKGSRFMQMERVIKGFE